MRHRAICTLCLLVAVAPHPAGAIETVTVTLGDVRAPGWLASGVSLDYRVAADRPPAATLRATSMTLPDPLGRLAAVRIHCRQLINVSGGIACRNGRLSARHPQLGEIGGAMGATFHSSIRTVDMQIAAMKIAGGTISVAANAGSAAWSVQIDASAIALEQILPAMESLVSMPGGLEPTGGASGTINISAAQGGSTQLTAALEMLDVEMNGFDDRVAASKLDLGLRLSAQIGDATIPLTLDLDAKDGELYAEPVYLDIGKKNAEMSMSGTWQPDVGLIVADTFRFSRADTVSVSGSMTVDIADAATLVDADLAIEDAQLPATYEAFLKPWLIGTPVDSLATAGAVHGAIRIRDGAPHTIDLSLTDLALRDDRERFALTGVNGDLRWRSIADAPANSEVSWTGGSLYGINLGPATAHFATDGNRLRLLESLRLPVLDGALDVRTLDLSGAGTDDPAVRFDAELQPLGLAELTGAIGWPRFGGTLSGRLPSLAYEGGNLTLGGSLVAQVFDGQVTVDSLRIAEPLGVLPVLTADVTMRNLNLEPLTEAFSFGRIEGRLHGDVGGLRMLAWKAVRFDARFYTPPKDRSRHRISQRAIESISSLGGFGGAASLSGIALALFDDFAYDRIDVSCRLRDEVCQMGGIGASGKGYYIVKGRGIPRIDVIGYSSNVNWSTLIDRLKGVSDRAPTTAKP